MSIVTGKLGKFWALLNNGMISRVLWNGHLAVEWASCCGMGIRRGTGILPVSIYFRAGRMPTLLLFSAKIQQRQILSYYPWLRCSLIQSMVV
ncbi:MAG: hypothetical protein F6J90_25595 [Moorea sp. SIOASIH]|uniref:hypothetical protein n=1 Tax=Moorena sp. SIOASIH TaxID=2607817 RepID=UPI0013BD7A8D|nr:hypothetical protein [Moorena sp. SIOASIH]NEO39524.1 hypothetical protein [Moorena sp. SIOASIH]